ncbi:MAG: TnsA endonuclease C-terminal domain-containing protein [Nostoc sp. ChiSLP01]|nr:TnsA endonuclease C-terminal domain-containing protein [Nostoc sp. CmiSLP01]MDZ8283714.1 TnsA endonuclease C-terminal domain-containing protein [Nostoc sp. ChiSLP01]
MFLVKNVEWIHSSYKLETAEINVDELHNIANISKSQLQESHSTINKITNCLDKEINLKIRTLLYIFKHLLANKKIIMDMQTSVIFSYLSST